MKKKVISILFLFLCNTFWGELELKIETDKKKYIIYEPIVVKVTLHNSGNSDIAYLPYLKLGLGVYKYIIIQNNSTNFLSPWYMVSILPKEKVLKPNESIYELFELIYESTWRPLTNGQYQIYVKHQNIKSDLYSFEIVSPEYEADKILFHEYKSELLNYLNMLETKWFISIKTLPELKKRFEHKKSVYLEAMNYSLLSWSLSRTCKAPMENEPDFKNAELYYNKIISGSHTKLYKMWVIRKMYQKYKSSGLEKKMKVMQEQYYKLSNEYIKLN